MTKESVTLSSSEVILMDFIIYAGGIEPNGLIYKLDLPKNARGFLTINAYLQVYKFRQAFEKEL